MLSEPLIQRTARQEPGNSASWGPLSGNACGLAGLVSVARWLVATGSEGMRLGRHGLAGRNPGERRWPGRPHARGAGVRKAAFVAVEWGSRPGSGRATAR